MWPRQDDDAARLETERMNPFCLDSAALMAEESLCQTSLAGLHRCSFCQFRERRVMLAFPIQVFGPANLSVCIQGWEMSTTIFNAKQVFLNYALYLPLCD